MQIGYERETMSLMIAYAAMGAAASAAVDLAPSAIMVEQVEVAQMSITRTAVVRIAPVIAAPPKPIRWKEKDGPKCVDIGMLAGLAIREVDAIDLTLRGGRNVRAKLEKGCPSAEFYSGFYLQRSRDGLVCAGRDVIHSRVGAACEVTKFKTLKPAK
jgi:hypothetical protein